MSYKTTQNNVAYEILKMKFIANILCWASLFVFVVKKIICFLSDLQFVYIFIYKVCTDVIEILYRFYKKKCLLYQSIQVPWNLPLLRMFYRILYIK